MLIIPMTRGGPYAFPTLKEPTKKRHYHPKRVLTSIHAVPETGPKRASGRFETNQAGMKHSPKFTRRLKAIIG